MHKTCMWCMAWHAEICALFALIHVSVSVCVCLADTANHDDVDATARERSSWIMLWIDDVDVVVVVAWCRRRRCAAAASAMGAGKHAPRRGRVCISECICGFIARQCCVCVRPLYALECRPVERRDDAIRIITNSTLAYRILYSCICNMLYSSTYFGVVSIKCAR